MRLLALCTLLTVAAVAATQLQSDAFVPLFMWSGQPYFREHAAASDPVSRTEFRDLFSQIISPKREPAVESKYLNSPLYYSQVHRQPEAIVAFVFNEMSSAVASREAGAYESHIAASPKNTQFHYLKTAMGSATSSLAAPFAVATTPITDDIINLHKELASYPQVFATQIDGSENDGTDQSMSGCDALLSHLGTQSNIFHNSRPELVIVKYSIIDKNDKCMQRVDEYVARMTNGNYLAVLSADDAFTLPLQTSFAETESHVISGSVNAQKTKQFQTQATPAAATAKIGIIYPGVRYITSDVFWALILALIMIIAISCGVCWVQSIETPARFTTTPLQLAKEY